MFIDLLLLKTFLYLNLLIGLKKEPFIPLKTKDVVDLVGPSLPLEDYKD